MGLGSKEGGEAGVGDVRGLVWGLLASRGLSRGSRVIYSSQNRWLSRTKWEGGCWKEIIRVWSERNEAIIVGTSGYRSRKM